MGKIQLCVYKCFHVLEALIHLCLVPRTQRWYNMVPDPLGNQKVEIASKYRVRKAMKVIY